MSNSVIIKRSKHLSLLADHRIDPITKKLLVVGDEVCVCAVCKTVYLKDVWVNTKKGRCCKQSRTLTYIPNTEYGVKEIPPVIQKSYKGHFVFFLLVAITFLGLFLYWFNLYKGENKKKNNLYYRLNNLSSELSRKEQRIKNINNELTYLKKDEYSVGKNSKSNSGGHDGNYLVFFRIKTPLELRSFYVYPETSGNLTVELFDIRNNLVGSRTQRISVSNIKKQTKFIVDFKIRKPGIYYLKRDGNINLWYDNKIKDYNYNEYKTDQIEIIGTDSNNSDLYNNRFYQYYYDVHYSPLIE